MDVHPIKNGIKIGIDPYPYVNFPVLSFWVLEIWKPLEPTARVALNVDMLMEQEMVTPFKNRPKFQKQLPSGK